MNSIDLTDSDDRASINEIITDIVGQVQKTCQQNDLAILLIKNQPILDTAMNMAAKSVTLHGIPNEKITNEKKFAHLCFWMLKLTPVSYVHNRPLVAFLNKLRSNPLRSSDKFLKISPKFKHVPVNTEVAYKTYITLLCSHRFDGDEIAEKTTKIYQTPYSAEIMKSFRFHNYSARSMAMFLETLTMERLA